LAIMLIKEYRITMPLTVEEYQIGQLYSVAEASKENTGGGDGIEVLKNEPIDDGKCQYTLKHYHLTNKVPAFIKMVAPKGSLILREEAWNAFPYCRTILTNPLYMKENFYLEIVSWHKPGKADIDNVHELEKAELKMREIVNIDIANDKIPSGDYKETEDPTKFISTKTGRGQLGPDWIAKTQPLMTCYKLVKSEFKWFGLQTRVENFIQSTDERLFRNFHRSLFCWVDKWHGLTIEDIRRIEHEAKEQLDESRKNEGLKGLLPEEQKK